ncbi:MAG TPA: diguanylate cyclase [Phycisphaerales bacterium]|nr:diguanylate cyclase [Phycisphaerales bacterium]
MNSEMFYIVKSTTEKLDISGGWDNFIWKKVEVMEIKNYMGARPAHFPKTQFKLLYDNDNLYVFFRVEDQYVKCVAERIHSNVCCDSCVEFFFSPYNSLMENYFNLEINCGGTPLLHYGSKTNRQPLSDLDCKKIKIYHSLPKLIKVEIIEPTEWFLQYRIPFEVIEKYSMIDHPADGVIWRANFFKCASKTSHPHWLTWSKVNSPKPQFHLPEYFGEIRFSNKTA